VRPHAWPISDRVQVGIYGQQFIKTARQITGAGSPNNGPLRWLQAALKK